MIWALDVDGVHLEVDPSVGGRVISLRLGDVEVLSTSAVDADNYGSTFWTSPQSDWGWPPPEEIDRAPYLVQADADGLTLSGAINAALGVRVTKRFSADRARRAIALEYSIHNVSAKPKTYAPWEVTRVPAGGLTFFPRLPTGLPSRGALRLQEGDDATWFSHVANELPSEGQKAFCCGEGGILAHAARGVLFVKSFGDVPPPMRAPGEAVIEIYANRRYVELEVQGRFARIEPGAAASWSVLWSLHRLPADLVAEAGSSDLLAFAAFASGVVR